MSHGRMVETERLIDHSGTEQMPRFEVIQQLDDEVQGNEKGYIAKIFEDVAIS